MSKKWLAQKLINLGTKLHDPAKDLGTTIPDASPADLAVLDAAAEYTMSLPTSRWALVQALRHLHNAGIEGDFVECGVWRGGNLVIARRMAENLGRERRIWAYDTFGGMTEPSEHDVKFGKTLDTNQKFEELQRDGFNDWCYASLEEVRANVEKTGGIGEVVYRKGDVRETLADAANLPDKIALLRLDTDFYDSTKIEMETLYPRLVSGGVLIVDDYGAWAGSKKAVDEYLGQPLPWLHYINRDARLMIKP
jgi:hypothetical protein